MVHALERSDLLETLGPAGLATDAGPVPGRPRRRMWPLGMVVSAVIVAVFGAALNVSLRTTEFDRLARQWAELQAHSRTRIDVENGLVSVVDLTPGQSVDAALVDTYANEIGFVERLDRALRHELIIDSDLRGLRRAMRSVVELHLAELRAVASYYRAPGPPSERPPEASRAFLVQSSDVSRELDRQRRRLGQPAAQALASS